MTLTIGEGQWFNITFPDGRMVSVSCSADEYSVTDDRGRILLSVGRDLGLGHGWDWTTVEWPKDGRFNDVHWTE
jgi:hypothetical protein